ncbi:hypothetical protein [Pseudocitrobacter cyperus]|uniref:Uncharacterized protein n=1 Tax=Pseudocitrobacter cyperus TaxID=3112843 RepID=A0ABV0HFJ8_9ENTR
MGRGFSGVGAILGSRSTAYLEVLGLMMLTSGRRLPPAEPKPQPVNQDKVKIPDSWELTEEQRQFIESFNPTEHKKKE